MTSDAKLEELALKVLKANVVEIRLVPKKVTNAQVETLPKNQRPFLYAIGNWGPIYAMIKGLVGRTELMLDLTKYLALEIAEKWPTQFHFGAGNVTGGMIPGWEVCKNLSDLFGRRVPFVYIRELRKTGGQKELITGIQDNPEIPDGAPALDMEELVNRAGTITNGAKCLREAGYPCNHGACILYYDNAKTNEELRTAGIEIASLFTLPRLIETADRCGIFSQELLREYYEFKKDPLQWQADRGLTHVEKGGTQ